MNNIEKNLARVHQQIERAAQSVNRASNEIELLAVSKTKPLSDIAMAYQFGQRVFGESYVQEAEQKITECELEGIEWHFIGPIQSNKTRKISELFSWVHSVDRMKIASRLDNHRPKHLPPLNILIQVNADNEPAKAGIHFSEIPTMAQHIASLQRVKLRGLMAIPQRNDNPQEQRKPFARMYQALLSLQQDFPDCDTLSMGMTNDLEAAIAEGSTLVRIGTAIFGAREY